MKKINNEFKLCNINGIKKQKNANYAPKFIIPPPDLI